MVYDGADCHCRVPDTLPSSSSSSSSSTTTTTTTTAAATSAGEVVTTTTEGTGNTVVSSANNVGATSVFRLETTAKQGSVFLDTSNIVAFDNPQPPKLKIFHQPSFILNVHVNAGRTLSL